MVAQQEMNVTVGQFFRQRAQPLHRCGNTRVWIAQRAPAEIEYVAVQNQSLDAVQQ